ncbi:protein OPI10 homolog [Eurytemora carolleeae]|uniref:protein OPI10 homolog n=1 Tax=Eurytemora carolleeae TaxID=1294199 RepID=UPI000C75B0C4|nr:protein OPI10 homolog [Eurytemora carolleeae]|eukprot:XP_023335195.1 protein OPI10 homolog [Eurytemora affinis]
MFGLIASGRLVSTNWEQISPTNCVTELVDADSVNHIVIFLTGQTPFPDGMGGAVYFAWPDPGGVPNWQLLGHISNLKPSAIFRIAKLKGGEASSSIQNSFTSLASVHHVNAVVGISVEPLAVVEGQTPAAQTEAANVSTFMEFSQKMLENLFNYATSFAASPMDMRQKPGESYVPLSCLQQWYTNFERRLQQNPNFWRS